MKLRGAFLLIATGLAAPLPPIVSLYLVMAGAWFVLDWLLVVMFYGLGDEDA